MAAIRIESDPEVTTSGLDGLLAAAWEEAGREGRMPPGWRPFDPVRSEGIAIREGGRLVAYAAVRPCEGMDSVDLVYVRRRARRPGTFRALIERVVERLKERGETRIMYAGYGWWRAPLPASFARAFSSAGWGRFEGVFLARPLEPGGPAPLPVAEGYSIEPWRDEEFEEVCACMLESPEPEALYWDEGLCRRSILNAAAPLRPLFPDGLGQVAFATAGGARKVAGFSLSTRMGYVNHVYTHPEHRGRGLASAMLTRLLAAQARLALRRATILTHETNPHAIALYERLGFRVDFRYPQFYLKW